MTLGADQLEQLTQTESGAFIAFIATAPIVAFFNWPESAGHAVAGVLGISGRNLIVWVLQINRDPVKAFKDYFLWYKLVVIPEIVEAECLKKSTQSETEVGQIQAYEKRLLTDMVPQA